MTRGFKQVIYSETATISEMATELAASIVAAASTLHEQHTERKILRVIEDHTPEVKSEYEELANFYDLSALPVKSVKCLERCWIKSQHPQSRGSYG